MFHGVVLVFSKRITAMKGIIRWKASIFEPNSFQHIKTLTT